MLILILFNSKEEYTYGDILNTTKIPPQEVKKNLLALTVKSKNHDKILSKDTTSLTKDTKIVANSDFKSKSIKVKILPVVLKETKEEQEDTQQKLDEERKWTLDATVVRIMKARKTLEHRTLVLETTQQLQSRFMPSPELIKKELKV